MRIIRSICAVKGIATVLLLTAPGLHDYATACSAFTVPFSFAVLYDAVIAERFGFVIVVVFVAYLAAWCISQVLLRIERAGCTLVGLCFVVGVNLCDIISAAISCLEAFRLQKVINILVSVVVLILSWFHIARRTGDGSVS